MQYERPFESAKMIELRLSMMTDEDREKTIQAYQRVADRMFESIRKRLAELEFPASEEQKMSWLDADVAKALGATERDGDWYLSAYHKLGMVSNAESHRAGLIDNEVWMPSLNWNHAMYAAQKLGLFADEECYLTYGAGQYHIVRFLSECDLAADKSGPIAICKALLKLAPKS